MEGKAFQIYPDLRIEENGCQIIVFIIFWAVKLQYTDNMLRKNTTNVTVAKDDKS